MKIENIVENRGQNEIKQNNINYKNRWYYKMLYCYRGRHFIILKM